MSGGRDLFFDARAAGAPVPAARAAARHLWLAVHLPQLALECLLRSAPVAASRSTPLPQVVVSGEGAQCEVVAVDAAALGLGIRKGHGLNAAYALCPLLEVVPRDLACEQQRLQTLARLATQYTPWVSLEPPDGLLFEVRGSLRLLGGTRALLARWRQDLAQQGLTAALALTPTPWSALWAARAATPGAAVRVITEWGALAAALSALPLTVTRWPESLRERLAEAGARQVGDILRLPRDGLARRYGPAMAQMLEQALGQRPTPRARTVLPERFMDTLELEAEATDVAHLQPAVEHLLHALETFLHARTAGVHGVVLQLHHRPGGPESLHPALTTVALGLVAPGASAMRLGALLRERLERLVLVAPVRSLRLRSGVVVPLPCTTYAVPGTSSLVESGAEAALLDRLRARLGEGAVHGVCLVPEHRPEAAWRRAAPTVRATLSARPAKAGDSRRSSGKAQATTPMRPLWLLPVPERLRACNGQPWHAGSLTAEHGPERIESGWWDGAEVQRDYYVVRREDGVRLWIFRERGAVAPGSWWLHGVFG
jgi:protein ImuB